MNLPDARMPKPVESAVHDHDAEQIRTVLYGDQWLFPGEMEVLHTRMFQRLYELKQLGWADRVYPDGEHSRFNHSLGVLEQAWRIAAWAYRNCDRESKQAEGKKAVLYAGFARSLSENYAAIRMGALLHDIFHIPFGHTLEDELGLLVRHDKDISRVILFLDRILAEVVFWNFRGLFQVDDAFEEAFWQCWHNGGVNLHGLVLAMWHRIQSNSRGKKKPRWRFQPSLFLWDYMKAGEILIYMSLKKAFKVAENVYRVWPEAATILPPLANKLWGYDYERYKEDQTVKTYRSPVLDPFKEQYICDLIGNTVCADILDYAKRDPHFTGLGVNYDERILQHFTLSQRVEAVSLDKQGNVELAIEKEPAADGRQTETAEYVRLAIRIVKHRVRFDALTEILQVLKVRYALTERVLFHRTKCAAGAMLGRAIALLVQNEGLGHLKENLWKFGDAEFLRDLEDKAKPEGKRQENTEERESRVAALRLLRGLRSRRFYKPVCHVRALDVSTKHETHPASKFKLDPALRTTIEEEVEETCELPKGSVVLYCPLGTNMKEAECLVLYDEGARPEELKKLGEDRSFGFFSNEAKLIAEMYEKLWNLYLFVDERYLFRWQDIEAKFVECFEKHARCPIKGHLDLHLKKYLQGEVGRYLGDFGFEDAWDAAQKRLSSEERDEIAAELALSDSVRGEREGEQLKPHIQEWVQAIQKKLNSKNSPRVVQ